MMHYPKTREEWVALRRNQVGSTESSALFGLNARMTAYELAVLKSGKVEDDFEGNERTEWGQALQRTIATMVAKRHGIKMRAMNGYVSNNGMGSSYDFEIVGAEGEGELAQLYRQQGPGVLEIKNVDGWIYRNEWVDGEAPAHIEIQVQHQLECCEREWAVIGVLVGGNKLHTLIRMRDSAVGAAIVRKVQLFWKNLNAGIMPPILLPQDADMVARVYSHAEPGKVLDAQQDSLIEQLCIEYYAAGQAAKEAETVRAVAKAKLLQKIGEAEKVLVSGYTISCGVVGATLIEAYTRNGYRNFQIRQKKQEKAA